MFSFIIIGALAAIAVTEGAHYAPNQTAHQLETIRLSLVQPESATAPSEATTNHNHA